MQPFIKQDLLGFAVLALFGGVIGHLTTVSVGWLSFAVLLSAGATELQSRRRRASQPGIKALTSTFRTNAGPTHYAMGFLLSPDGRRVALIRKNRPARLAGLLTGIGGHRESGEACDECLVREMWEEAGVVTKCVEWTHFATVDNATMYMPCFVLRSNKVDQAFTREDEPIAVYAIEDIAPAQAAPLALDLIALAVDHRSGITTLS